VRVVFERHGEAIGHVDIAGFAFPKDMQAKYSR
jgi:hypothetical protein